MNSGSSSPTTSNLIAQDLSLRHLYAEIARLDLLLQQQIIRWRAAGQDPTDAFRGLYVSDAEAAGLMNRPLGGSWAEITHHDEASFKERLAAAELQSQAFSNSARTQQKSLRLEKLITILGLNEFERDVLLLALAPSLDLRYQRIYAYLQDDVTKKVPTVNMALDLFCIRADRIQHLKSFNLNAPLYRFQVLKNPASADPLLGRPLQIDPAIPAWLLGHYDPENISPPASSTPDETSNGTQLPIYDPSLIISMTGPDEHAQESATRRMAANMERPLLSMDLAAHKDQSYLSDSLRRTLRDALLFDALPVFEGFDAVLEADSPPKIVLKTIFEHPDMVIIRSKDVWRPRGMARSRRIRRIPFPIPQFRDRLMLWERLLVKHPDRKSLDLPHLAGQFALTTGQILDAFEAACDAAEQRSVAIETEDLLSAARSHSNPRLGLLARKIDPRFEWDDIILPREQLTILREITATVRQRPKVLDEWGVGEKLASSRGVTVLFAGPPGTGKTMAAEIMSADLGLDLYKIDLSGVVSKYIGETEKNLEKVFEEAASSNAILFFDEADALFGKRSEVRDAHDRYANLEISYLLQRMEAYDGVTILATNLRANLDEAFTRRLQFAIDFPFPEEEDRLRIWQALLPPDLPIDKTIDFSLLAKRFRIAGGNIRNVIVNAAYLAAADGGHVTMEHLLHGTRRELQKMGRLLNEEDLVVG